MAVYRVQFVRPPLILRVAAISMLVVWQMVTAPSLVAQSEPTTSSSDATTVYWDQVRPVLQKRCFACHRGEQARGGFDLSTVAGVKAGSTSGAAVVSGKPEQSLLFTLPAHMENPKMPPSGNRIPQSELDLISGWITGGLAERIAPAASDSAGAEGRKTAISINTRRPGQSGMSAGNASDHPDTASMISSGNITESIKIRSRAELMRGVDQSLPGLSRNVAPITAMAASPTATKIAVSGYRQVVLADWETGDLVSSMPFPEGSAFALRFSTDGNLLLIAGGQAAAAAAIVICRVDTGERIFESTGEGDAILAADLSSTGRHAVLGGPQKIVRIVDTIDAGPSVEIRKHTDWIMSTAFSPDGLLVATGDRFGAVYIWETSSGQEFLTLRGHTGAVQGLHWNHTGDRLVTSGHDGTIRTWNLHDGRQLSLIQTSINGILCSAVTPDFSTIYAGGRNHNVVCYRAGEEEVGWSAAMDDEVVQLTLTHDGECVVAADIAGNLRVLDSGDGRLIRSISLPTVSPSTVAP